LGNRGNARAVYQADRQMPEQVDGAGMGARVPGRHELVEQTLDSRSDALQGAHGSEQGS